MNLLSWVTLALAALVIACALGAYSLYELRFEPAHIVALCEHAEYPLVCFNDQIKSVLSHHGLAAAFDVLAAGYAADPAFAASCHGNTHDLGEAAYEQFHRTGAIQLTPEVSYCGFGFYHGFMIALLAETHDLNEARAFCAYAGPQVPVPAGYSEGACYHGIGHGVTDGSDPTVWGNEPAMAEPGLALCNQVAQTDEWKKRCFSGVFNSLAELSFQMQYKISLGNNPFAWCANDAYTTLEKEACFEEMNYPASRIARNDLLQALALTSTITDTNYRSIAIRGIADFYVKVNPNGPAHLSASDMLSCGTLGPTFEDDCVNGLVDGIWEFGPPGTQYQEATATCGADTLPADIATACFDREQSSYWNLYTPNIAAVMCTGIPERFKIAPCLSSTSPQT